jgi:hypothetical protein
MFCHFPFFSFSGLIEYEIFINICICDFDTFSLQPMLLLLPNTNSFQQFEDYDTVKPVMGTLKYGPIRQVVTLYSHTCYVTFHRNIER